MTKQIENRRYVSSKPRTCTEKCWFQRVWIIEKYRVDNCVTLHGLFSEKAFSPMNKVSRVRIMKKWGLKNSWHCPFKTVLLALKPFKPYKYHHRCFLSYLNYEKVRLSRSKTSNIYIFIICPKNTIFPLTHISLDLPAFCHSSLYYGIVTTNRKTLLFFPTFLEGHLINVCYWESVYFVVLIIFLILVKIRWDLMNSYFICHHNRLLIFFSF